MPKLGGVWGDEVKVQPPYWLVVPSSRNAGFPPARCCLLEGRQLPWHWAAPLGTLGGLGEFQTWFWPISPLLVEQPWVAPQTWLLRCERDGGSVVSQDSCEDGDMVCVHMTFVQLRDTKSFSIIINIRHQLAVQQALLKVPFAC